MGLFNNESKEEKAAKKQAKIDQKNMELLRKFGLEELQNPVDIASVKNIFNELSGTGLMELGVALGGGSDRDIQKNQMYYQRALIEQKYFIRGICYEKTRLFNLDYRFLDYLFHDSFLCIGLDSSNRIHYLLPYQKGFFWKKKT